MVKRPVVYVINEPLRQGSDGYKPLFDIEPAREFGDLVHVLPAGRLPSDPAPSLERLRLILKDYVKRDFLLLVGDLVMVAAATAIAARSAGGVVSVLSWHSSSRRYTARTLHIY